MNRFLTGIILSGITPFLASPVHAQTDEMNFTTLFTSPAEREYLDFLRADFLLNNPEEDFNVSQEVPAVPLINTDDDGEENAVTRYQLSGIFMQRDGSRTAWINGASYEESNLPANMQILMSGTQAVLRISTDTGRFDLKAGQTLDVVRGEIMENWRNSQTSLPEMETPDSESNTLDQSPESTADTVSITAAESNMALNTTESNPEQVSAEADLSLLDDLQTLMDLTNTSSIDELREVLQAQGATTDAQNPQL